jgi:hypothetical protein
VAAHPRVHAKLMDAGLQKDVDFELALGHNVDTVS